MCFHFRQFLRAIILASFSLFLIRLHVTDEITKYINPKYIMMSQIAAWIFVFLFLIQLFRIWEPNDHTQCHAGCEHSHQGSAWVVKLISISILLFPLLVGFAFPPAVLDASLAEKKGTVLPQVRENKQQDSLSAIDQQEALPNDNYLSKEEYNQRMEQLKKQHVIEMKEDVFAPYYEEIQTQPKSYLGKKIKVSGFVYKEAGLSPHQLVISRFLITHCLADASVIGFLTEFEKANLYQPDTWMEIEGILRVTTYNGVEVPVIKADKWKVIPKPSQPYIYPISIKIQ
jgi:putative membrane protein